jgi:hypothetical protein
MKLMNVSKSGVEKAECVISQNRIRAEENKISSDEREWLISPRAGIKRVRNSSVSRALLLTGARLAVFRYARASEHAKTKPVVHSILGDEEYLEDRSLAGFVQEVSAKSVDHRDGERLLSRKRLFPGSSLLDDLSQHG